MMGTLSGMLHAHGLFALWAFALGCCLGSFYGVCVERFLEGRTVTGRSTCPHCGQRLKARHLVPLISWLCLGGRCAFCRTAIGVFCPVIELVSGLAAGLLALRFGPALPFWLLLAVTGVLIVASGIDLASFILPDRLLLPLMVAAIPLAVWGLGLTWQVSLGGALLGSGLLWGLRFLFWRLRGVEALGLGDVKLVFALGALCGVYEVPTLLLAGSLSGLLAAPLWLWGKKTAEARATPMPFGPFLSLGGFFGVLL